MAEGTPEKVAAEAGSFTGQYLKMLLKRSNPSPLAGEGGGEGVQDRSRAQTRAQSVKKARRKAASADVGQPDLIVAK